jgi:hypothetical protein
MLCSCCGERAELFETELNGYVCEGCLEIIKAEQAEDAELEKQREREAV